MAISAKNRVYGFIFSYFSMLYILYSQTRALKNRHIKKRRRAPWVLHTQNKKPRRARR